MNLRPYQLDAVAGVEKGFEDFQRLLGVLPTGAGKTVVFSHIAKRRHDAGQRTLILAHREELIDQAIDKLHLATGIAAQKEKAEDRASLSAAVVVASVQTMTRRLDRWPRDHFGLVVADEAHHALSDSWQTVLNHFDADVLGVTATPSRGDKRSLGQFFESIAFEVGLFDLINDGWLSRIGIRSIPLAIDLSAVRQTAGDYNEADLGSAIEPYLGEIAKAIRDNAGFRKTLAFLPLINTSRKFVEHCRQAGLTAEHVDGNSPDRKEILARFSAGEFDVLSNAMLLTEGYDDPSIDCVVVLRPTKSQPLYAQMVGRGTRTAPGKADLLLLDFLWNHTKLPICRPAHLIAKTEAEAEVITKLAHEKSHAIPAETAEQMDLEILATDATALREESLRKQLEANKNKKAKTISAEEFALSHNNWDAADYEPTMAWESMPVSDAQSRYLKRAHIDLGTVKGRGHASKLLDIYFATVKPRMAAPKAVALMRRMPGLCASIGIPDLTNVTAAQAGRFFAALNKRKQQPEFAE